MGIPRFFKFILQNFAGCVSQIKVSEGFNENIENLYIDANGIIHTFAQLYNFGKDDEHVFSQIMIYLDKLLEIIKPTKLFYIAIDGVAPVAKQIQQRQRRFKASLKKTQRELRVFDSCSITPGTCFMKKLSKYMADEIEKRIKTDHLWASVKVIFSGPEKCGEGEHKIAYYIRTINDKNTSHCIYGLDADLFMIGLLTHCKNFFLLREMFNDTSVNTDFNTDFYKVNVGHFRTLLCETLETNINKDVINDFVFMCFFVGNDFVPALSMFNNLPDNLMFLINLYKRFFVKKHIFITNDDAINITAFFSLCKKIGRQENDLLFDQFYNQKYPNVTLMNSLKDLDNPRRGIIYSRYRANYYKKASINVKKREEVNEMAKCYIQSLDWINYYYHKNIKNWRWFYPYHYSPMVKDIVTFIESPAFKIHRISTVNLRPVPAIIQLLSVVPPKSMHLFSKKVRKIYETEEYKNYYPHTICLDFEGKLCDWEAVALLPLIDVEKVLELYNKL